MCVVSMAGEWYRDRINEPYWQPVQPWLPPQPYQVFEVSPPVTREELEKFKADLGSKFDELKKMMEEAKDLLTRAKEYDEKNNEPECEMEDKVAILKRLAELVGVDLSAVFAPPSIHATGQSLGVTSPSYTINVHASVQGGAIDPHSIYNTRYNTGKTE
jgi:hypothetical protein